MPRLAAKLKTLFRKLRSRFPSDLPRTRAQLDAYYQDVLELYALPDDPSYKQAFATFIMHLGPVEHRKSKHFFARSIYRRMANQIAYDTIDELRRNESKTLNGKAEETTDASTSTALTSSPTAAPIN